MSDFEMLLSAGRIGRLRVPNRMIAGAMLTRYCNEDGEATERFASYLEEKARGGWGLIITEDYAINSHARSYPNVAGLWDDGQMPSHKAMVDRVHDAGGRICVQLYHPGRQGDPRASQAPLLAPSAISDPATGLMPREMMVDQIESVVADFAAAAIRAVACGFDAIEVHGGHGYLINEFMSSLSNKRTDGYGGSPRNRGRLAVEIVEAIRAAVGDEVPILFRLNVCDYLSGGITPREAALFARLLEQSGVDLISCTRGQYASKEYIIPPTAISPVSLLDDMRPVRDVVDIPLAAVGRINDPYLAETVLERGEADFVVMSRASLADPYLPRKIERGQADDVRRCIACCAGCTGQLSKGNSITCMVNPALGERHDVRGASEGKTILVVGAGVSGCVCAIEAASRGHYVTLLEQGDRVGGQWNIASVPPGKEDYASFLLWLDGELKRQGVDVKLGATLNQAHIDLVRPDHIVIATGSKSLYPPIPGIADPSVTTDARDVLAGKGPTRGNVAVIGGGLVGAETAVYLSAAGCEVTIYEMQADIALECAASPRKLLLEELSRKGVRTFCSRRVAEVKPGVVVSESLEGETFVDSGFDSVVVALGARPAPVSLEMFNIDSDVEVHTIGDAATAKMGLENIAEGYRLGCLI